jgi:hypothetical protein
MRLRSLAVLATPLLLSCGDDPTGVSLPITVSGVLEGPNAASVPANARILVVWGVTAGDDYSYIFGSGTVGTDGRFTITFNSEPPAEALNNGRLGVGMLVLTTDQTLGEGRVPDGEEPPPILGLSEDHSIIFAKGTQTQIDWARNFSNGYHVGEVQRSTTGFDSFVRVGLDDLVIVVDDINNLNPPNWT